MGRGRPFRFIVAVVAGWTGLRVAMLWPQIDEPGDLISAIVPSAEAADPRPIPVVGASNAVRSTHQASVASSAVFTAPMARPNRPEAGAIAPNWPVASHAAADETAPPVFGAPKLPTPDVAPPLAPVPSRWSASAWVLVRDGGGRAATGGPRLGGGQAGMRVAYALTSTVAAVGRVSAPLAGRGKEAALGVEWQPFRLPIRLVAEQRFSLDGGGSAPVVGAIGGLYGVPIAAKFALEGYAQAGLIDRDGVSGFVDVIGRATRTVASRPVRLDIGAGSWASAQRGAERIDVGLTIGVAVPLGGAALRVTADWRLRVAGDAQPGSGPALTLGLDL